MNCIASFPSPLGEIENSFILYCFYLKNGKDSSALPVPFTKLRRPLVEWLAELLQTSQPHVYEVYMTYTCIHVYLSILAFTASRL
jgi:hypothetical protein